MPLQACSGRAKVKINVMEKKLTKTKEEKKICMYLKEEGIYCWNKSCHHMFCVISYTTCKFYVPKTNAKT